MIHAHADNCEGVCYHGASNKGIFSILFQSSGRVTTGTIKLDGEPDFFEIHGWLMWAGWGILGFIMLVSNRYMKRFWWLHMWIHRVAGLLILTCTYVMGLMAMQHLSWEIAQLPHTILGFIILILVGVVAIGGIAARYALVNFKWKTQKS